jgi:hypothetical protein
MSHPVLLKNQLRETGLLSFVDITHEVGLDTFRGDMTSAWLDIDHDGVLDLVVFSNMNPYIKFNNLKIPYTFQSIPNVPDENLNFMPENLTNATNGGEKHLFLQKNGKFILQDNKNWGLETTPFTLAVGTGDFNQDGWTDLYIANDFGPDEMYLNDHGKKFLKIKGSFFGDLGNDTYKGMNVSIGDINNDGFLDIYVSNIHHPLVREGSLMWSIDASSVKDLRNTRDRAQDFSILNEGGHGWGASYVDLNNDGWPEIVQTNGMFDNKFDLGPIAQKIRCYDYWYANEKIYRSPNEIQRNAMNWANVITGCVMPNQMAKLYLNISNSEKTQFYDIASQVGLTELSNTRSVISADFDNNGTRDLLIVDLYGEHKLYKNNLAINNKSNWIGFSLLSKNKDCSELGSTVILKQEFEDHSERNQLQEIQINSGYGAQSDSRIHFGLGNKIGKLSLKVKWCGQFLNSYTDISANKYQTIVFH